jgi:NAD(P)-dependent dehydrogenase (short-subunit alcohol dehydrogenase family)
MPACLCDFNGKELAGTAVIVTGATSGLGRAVALRLAAAGANVALLGRSQRDLDVFDQIKTKGLRALPIQADLAHAASLGEIVDRAVRELGELSVLVNAAGTDVPGSAEDFSLKDWERVLAVNLTALSERSQTPRGGSSEAVPDKTSGGSWHIYGRGRVGESRLIQDTWACRKRSGYRVVAGTWVTDGPGIRQPRRVPNGGLCATRLGDGHLW